MANYAEPLAEEADAAYLCEEPIVEYVYEECGPVAMKMMQDALKKIAAIDARRKKEAGAVVYGQKSE